MTAYGAADEDEDDWTDGQADDGDDREDADDDPTVPCPYCRREIPEDSPWCPYCERFISEEDHASPRKPAWIIATALLCLGVAVWWVLAAW